MRKIPFKVSKLKNFGGNGLFHELLARAFEATMVKISHTPLALPVTATVRLRSSV